MRALLLIVVVGCSPEIVSDGYLCGPDETCPSGQACDGSDNSCVIPSTAMPFACDPMTLHEPDDTPAQAFPINGLTCVSTPTVIDGCLAAADTQNWVGFTAPSNCSAVEVQAKLTFPIAFEPLTFSLSDVTTATLMMMVSGETPCPKSAGDPPAGGDQACITFTLTGGHSYGLQVAPAGGGDCDGQCNYNRYQLTVLLDTPG